MPRVTLQDIADQLGVDVSTVSRALSPDRSSLISAATRARVLEAAATLGYRGNVHASALRRGRTRTIGVVVADLSNPFIGPVLRGIANALHGRGLLPIMTESRDSSEQLADATRELLAHSVDGVITTAGRYDDRRTLRSLAKEVPVVLAVRDIPRSGLPAVSHDDVAGGRLAAQHLIELGHTRVAQLRGPADISSFEGRASGFGEEAARAGIEVIDIVEPVKLPTVETGRSLMQVLVDRTGGDLPSAVFAHNDTMAVGALAVLQEQGLRCPEDVSVIGYNNVPLTGYLAPPLTTVDLPAYTLGRLATELVVALIEGGEPTTDKVSLSPKLIERRSTAPPRAEGRSHAAR